MDDDAFAQYMLNRETFRDLRKKEEEAFFTKNKRARKKGQIRLGFTARIFDNIFFHM